MHGDQRNGASGKTPLRDRQHGRRKGVAVGLHVRQTLKQPIRDVDAGRRAVVAHAYEYDSGAAVAREVVGECADGLTNALDGAVLPIGRGPERFLALHELGLHVGHHGFQFGVRVGGLRVFVHWFLGVEGVSVGLVWLPESYQPCRRSSAYRTRGVPLCYVRSGASRPPSGSAPAVPYETGSWTEMDPALEKIFRHPIMVRYSMQSGAPELADTIDFSTLEVLGPELVGDDLARRFPEMLWIARTRHTGAQVVFLLYLQAENDPMMPVWVAMDSRQAVLELRRRMRPPPDLATLDVVPIVLYHGAERWTAPRSLDELFSRDEAGDPLDTGRKRKST
ncbi:MAG: Rpn family recombination-promoting nuclease/putative transposase [Gemmatimonadota bacterium]|nr:Rpn family recombination-promoting nuclease/putative transposase [Gemmatimonadota bacterium]MDE2872672.1 Rpn family recombination-promoting nuclease/putative transposase [Gemmatimonadota bacterium]